MIPRSDERPRLNLENGNSIPHRVQRLVISVTVWSGYLFARERILWVSDRYWLRVLGQALARGP
jgi:hypothetical protein